LQNLLGGFFGGLFQTSEETKSAPSKNKSTVLKPEVRENKHSKKIQMIVSKAAKVISKVTTKASVNPKLQKNLTVILSVQRLSNPTIIGPCGAFNSSPRVNGPKKPLGKLLKTPQGAMIVGLYNL
jgi:hypothetical protein